MVYIQHGILLNLKIMKDILQCVTCMNLGDIMLSVTCQSQKDKYYLMLYEISRTVKITEVENTMVVARVWGEGEMRNCCAMSAR